MVTVGGGAMGFVMALFMNAVEFRELEYGRSKMPTRAVLRVELILIINKERLLQNVGYESRIRNVWMFLFSIRVLIREIKT